MISDNLYNELFILLIGIVFFIIGRYHNTKNNRLRDQGARVKGVVFEIICETNHKSSNTYYPVVRFVTAEHQEWITKKYEIGGQWGAYNEGDEVDVIYNTANPRDFILDDVRTKLTSPLFMYVGLAAVIGFIIAMFFVK